MKKLLSVVLTGVLALSMMAGCSQKDVEKAAEQIPSQAAEAAKEIASQAAEAGEAIASAAGDVIKDVEGAENSAFNKDTLVVGTNAEFPPFEYVGADGNPDGFDIALMKAIGENLGKKIEVQNMQFDSLIASIGNKIDIAIAGMTVTEERKQSVDFSDSYYDAVQSVIVPKDSAIKTADDLKNLTIGVQLGTTGDFMVADIEGATASQYNKGVDAVNDLLNGRVDCVIIDKNPAQVFVSLHSDELVAIEGTELGFEAEHYAIAMPKGDAYLVEMINGALEALKADGTYDKLVKQYIEAQ